MTTFFEIIVRTGKERDFCVFGLFNLLSFCEIIRNSGFVLILFHVTKNSTETFPLPFLWVFKDLSKFIFEPVCLRVFMDYLEKKEPQSRLTSLT